MKDSSERNAYPQCRESAKLQGGFAYCKVLCDQSFHHCLEVPGELHTLDFHQCPLPRRRAMVQI